MKTPTELSKRLREWRAANNLTQKQAAARLRVSNLYTYASWEASRRSPLGPTLAWILTVIDGEGAR